MLERPEHEAEPTPEAHGDAEQEHGRLLVDERGGGPPLGIEQRADFAGYVRKNTQPWIDRSGAIRPTTVAAVGRAPSTAAGTATFETAQRHM